MDSIAKPIILRDYRRGIPSKTDLRSINFLLPESLILDLKTHSDTQGKSMSAVVRELLFETLVRAKN